MLEQRKLEVDFWSRSKLHLACASAMAQAYRELAKRAGGDYSPDPQANRFPPYRPPAEWANNWRNLYAIYVNNQKPAPATIKRQTGVLRRFFEFVGHDDPRRVTSEDVASWIEHRSGLVSARTVRDADVAHPRVLFNWARKRIGQNPFDGAELPAVRQEELRNREFTLEEAEQVLAATLLPTSSRMSPEGAAARR